MQHVIYVTTLGILATAMVFAVHALKVIMQWVKCGRSAMTFEKGNKLGHHCASVWLPQCRIRRCDLVKRYDGAPPTMGLDSGTEMQICALLPSLLHDYLQHRDWEVGFEKCAVVHKTSVYVVGHCFAGCFALAMIVKIIRFGEFIAVNHFQLSHPLHQALPTKEAERKCVDNVDDVVMLTGGRRIRSVIEEWDVDRTVVTTSRYD
ncbi:unnamed protein product [Hydatigera taeniaeformis]|uniref:Lipase_3 domain-containing protein n=1 Tax=Hydatigena taeniaeformis TaxID=6205 RepID=A0A0R3X7E9_HYDTA|nr:unnamed protein product [Hydatigera taeniaeformis]